MDVSLNTITTAATSVDWIAVGVKVLWAGGGSLVTLAAAYVLLIKDVAYIKGRVDELHDQSEDIDKLAKGQGAIQSDIRKIKRHVGLSHHG